LRGTQQPTQVGQLITRSSAKLTKASLAKLTTEEGCMGYAEIIMFAIQAALQLYGAGRRAYVDGTRGRTLILPLPRMDGVQLDSARAWFTLEAQGIALAARMPQLARCWQATRRTTTPRCSICIWHCGRR
jgi:hypothetical protein